MRTCKTVNDRHSSTAPAHVYAMNMTEPRSSWIIQLQSCGLVRRVPILLDNYKQDLAWPTFRDRTGKLLGKIYLMH